MILKNLKIYRFLYFQTSKRGVIKPVAFKPVISPPNRYVSTPQHRRPLPDARSASHSEPRSANHSHDDGYASQDYSHVHSGSNLSHNSSGHGDSDRSLSFTADHTRHYKSPVFMSSNISGISTHVDHFMHTPSPSDSGVGELEAMLRDKDAEINQLRETIEVNERAIIQVYEEKIQNLQVEVKEVHDDYEARLRKCQDKGFRTEQSLLLQLFNLQQERKNSKSDTELLRSEKEKCDSKVEALEKENNQLKTRLEEIEWELCQKSGEISLLKSQLKDSKDEIGSKSTDMLGLKSKIKDLNESKEEGNKESQRLKQENKVLRADCESVKNENEKLRLELQKVKRELAPVRDVSLSPSSQTESPLEAAKLKQQLKSSQEAFEKERDQWHVEKDKVIRYQKQLQLNYVQMCRKNRMLEQEVQQLTLELENRDISLMPDNETPVEQESVC